MKKTKKTKTLIDSDVLDTVITHETDRVAAPASRERRTWSPARRKAQEVLRLKKQNEAGSPQKSEPKPWSDARRAAQLRAKEAREAEKLAQKLASPEKERRWSDARRQAQKVKRQNKDTVLPNTHGLADSSADYVESQIENDTSIFTFDPRSPTDTDNPDSPHERVLPEEVKQPSELSEQQVRFAQNVEQMLNDLIKQKIQEIPFPKKQRQLPPVLGYFVKKKFKGHPNPYPLFRKGFCILRFSTPFSKSAALRRTSYLKKRKQRLLSKGKPFSVSPIFRTFTPFNTASTRDVKARCERIFGLRPGPRVANRVMKIYRATRYQHATKQRKYARYRLKLERALRCSRTYGKQRHKRLLEVATLAWIRPYVVWRLSKLDNFQRWTFHFTHYWIHHTRQLGQLSQQGRDTWAYHIANELRHWEYPNLEMEDEDDDPIRYTKLSETVNAFQTGVEMYTVDHARWKCPERFVVQNLERRPYEKFLDPKEVTEPTTYITSDPELFYYDQRYEEEAKRHYLVYEKAWRKAMSKSTPTVVSKRVLRTWRRVRLEPYFCALLYEDAAPDLLEFLGQRFSAVSDPVPALPSHWSISTRKTALAYIEDRHDPKAKWWGRRRRKKKVIPLWVSRIPPYWERFRTKFSPTFNSDFSQVISIIKPTDKIICRRDPVDTSLEPLPEIFCDFTKLVKSYDENAVSFFPGLEWSVIKEDQDQLEVDDGLRPMVSYRTLKSGILEEKWRGLSCPRSAPSDVSKFARDAVEWHPTIPVIHDMGERLPKVFVLDEGTPSRAHFTSALVLRAFGQQELSTANAERFSDLDYEFPSIAKHHVVEDGGDDAMFYDHEDRYEEMREDRLRVFFETYEKRVEELKRDMAEKDLLKAEKKAARVAKAAEKAAAKATKALEKEVKHRLKVDGWSPARRLAYEKAKALKASLLTVPTSEDA